MTPAQLESLLTDRALGELPPEVGALLEAYLAQNPAAAASAATLDTAVRLARAAVAAPREQPAALDLVRLRRARPAARAALRTRDILRLAASLAVGLGLGWMLRPVPPTPPPEAAPVVATAPFANPRIPAAATTNFWSITRFASVHLPPQPRKSL